MPTRWAWIDRSAAGLWRLAPAPMRRSCERDAVLTLQQVCAAASQRGGRLALVRAAARELSDLAVAVAAARLGRLPAVSGGQSSAGPQRMRFMMLDALRHGWRRVRGRPGLTTMSVAMLGLAVGLATAMFTIVDALLLRPVPFRDPDHLALLYTIRNSTGYRDVPATVFRALKESGIFQSIEATSSPTGTVVLDGGPEPVIRGAARVSPGMFAMLGASPIRGRGFLPDEGRAGSDDRVMLSETVWRAQYAGDPALIGSTIDVDGRPHTLVGIMPADFRFPEWNTVVWRPLDYLAPPPPLKDELPGPYVRWAADRSKTEMDARTMQIVRAADPLMAKAVASLEPVVSSNRDEYSDRAVPLLAAGAGLVFLVLCANVSGLQLSQFTARRREYGMCAALGASRARLIREASAESVIVGALGIAAGVGIAWGLVAAARGLLPDVLLAGSLNPINLDLRAFAAASLAGVIGTVVAGALPAWIGTSVSASGALAATERAGTETRTARLASRGLLVVEIALACSLLVSATLLVRSFINLSAAERGLRSEGVITAWISLPAATFPDAASRQSMLMSIEAAMRDVPGIEEVTISFGLPPAGGATHFYDDWRTDLPGATPLKLQVGHFEVRPDFFSFYDLPILRGRGFEPGDTADTAVIGEQLAALLWPGSEPIGRTFSFGKRTFRVLGITREIRLPSLERRGDRPEFYTPLRGGLSLAMVGLRCGTCPALPAIRRQIDRVHPSLQIGSLRHLEDVFRQELVRPRATAALGLTFAAIAVLAAAGGLLSVLSYAVNRRRREFGIRVALGASASQIRRLVLRDGLIVAAMGLVAGSVGAWLIGRALSSMQYGITASDPLSWTIVVAALGLTTIAAAWRPARHAMRVDPARLLREE